MIFGECPYCDAPVTNWLAEGVELPVVTRETCETCAKTYWLRHSRLDPDACRIEDWNPGEKWESWQKRNGNLDRADRAPGRGPRRMI